jgi:predicted small lipoprotein YifL
MTPLRSAIFLLSLAALAACGVDGDPQPPAQSATQPGLTIKGQVGVGIVGS